MTNCINCNFPLGIDQLGRAFDYCSEQCRKGIYAKRHHNNETIRRIEQGNISNMKVKDIQKVGYIVTVTKKK